MSNIKPPKLSDYRLVIYFIQKHISIMLQFVIILILGFILYSVICIQEDLESISWDISGYLGIKDNVSEIHKRIVPEKSPFEQDIHFK